MNNLKADASKIEQPKNLKIKLKEHQKSSIYAMQHLEDTGEINITIKSAISSKGTIQIKENALVDEENIFGNNYWYHSWYNRGGGDYKDINYLINSNFGILSDKVGSGKTLMIVGLIVNKLVPNNNPKILNSSQMTSIKYLDNIEPIKTNLILIPHNLVSQWYKSFTDNTKLRVKLIHRQSALVSIKSVYNLECDEVEILPEETLEYYDVVIVTSTMAQDFFIEYKAVKWARIIIDEVLSIKLPTDIPWVANFIWFITATPSGLAYIKKIYIRDIFSSLQRVVFNFLVVKNNDEYVSNSMNLPPFNQILIRCFTPKMINIIKNYVSEEIINMLNAGNVSEAVAKINCNADTDDNIFKAITTKIDKELHNNKVELVYLTSLIPTDAKTHEETLKRINEKIASLTERKNTMEAKIKSYATEACPVCYTDFENPAVMKCCGNLFCIPCLTQVNGLCPMCRTTFVLADLNVIVKEKNKKDKKKVEEKELLSKDKNLINLIKKKPNGRFLIFSCYEHTNDKISKILKDENITYSKLLGSSGSINNIINRFNGGELNVLLLNAQYYGSGLNLQMATDIIIYHEMNIELETQIIGRAQRIGRTEPLNVYYLLHENEKHNVTNPSLDLSIYNPNDKKLIEFITGTTTSSKVDDTVEVSQFWDSDEERQFKKSEEKRLTALEKVKVKKVVNRKKKNNDV